MEERETLGSYLRSLREERKGSLEEMSLATRVSLGQLEALEADRTAELPAPVFVKGFIRAYCHFLGQPPDEALGRYRELSGAGQSVEAAVAPARSATSRSASPIVISVMLLIVLGAGVLALKVAFKHPPVAAVTPVVNVEPPTEVQSPGKLEPVARGASLAKAESVPNVEHPIKVASPAAPAPVPPSPAPTSAASQRLTVKANELTWLRIQTDDATAAEALLPPGTTREWTAEKRFLLTVGNAGGVELTLNGQPVPPLGAKGTVIRGLQLPPSATAAGS
jgi:cytoskeleton protein RodZ